MKAENNWKYIVKIYPKRKFEYLKTFVKYINSDYQARMNGKFKHILIPQIDEDGEYFLYGVTTHVEPCETKNAIIEIIKEYSVDMADEISNYVFKSETLTASSSENFKCSMYFTCSSGLNGKPKEIVGYYCYEWYDVDNGYVFYVGKGTKNRWKQLKPDRRNADFLEYYNNHNCSCRFVKTGVSEEDAYVAERERLEYLHGINQAHCNHDSGGRCGATNYGAYNGMYRNTHSDAVKKKLSEINKKCQNRSSNGNAKPVYVYTEQMQFLKEYGCVPDAIEDLFGTDKITVLQGRIYHAMSKSQKPVNGYYFSREKVS